MQYSKVNQTRLAIRKTHAKTVWDARYIHTNIVEAKAGNLPTAYRFELLDVGHPVASDGNVDDVEAEVVSRLLMSRVNSDGCNL